MKNKFLLILAFISAAMFAPAAHAYPDYTHMDYYWFDGFLDGTADYSPPDLADGIKIFDGSGSVQGDGIPTTYWAIPGATIKFTVVDPTVTAPVIIFDVDATQVSYNDLKDKPTLTVGATGATGATGAAGAAGAVGATGATGAVGATGAAGSNGSNGTNATTTSNATGSVPGLESGADKTKLDALPLIQRIRVQTDSSGSYTWTYPTAYGSGVIPVVSVVAEGGSTVPLNVQLASAPTNTSATFKVLTLPSTSVLSIVVLGAPAGAQAYLDITATAP